MKQTSFLHTLILLCILVGGGLTFWYAQGNIRVQLIVGFMTAASYVAWGIIHHAVMGTLHRKVVIEYVLIGLIAVVLLTTLAL